MEYVRSRHGDLREDFGRSERQQQVLVALRANLLNRLAGGGDSARAQVTGGGAGCAGMPAKYWFTRVRSSAGRKSPTTTSVALFGA